MHNVLGQTLAERYEIQREVGRGGMATVYAATDLQTGGIVAVKVMRADLVASLGGGRFAREMHITSQLRHPGIVPLLDTGEVGGVPFYTMPFIEGETLAQRLLREKQVGLETSLQIMRELLDALQHAHDAGILHRDIKPANILLAGGRALLADFGVARALDTRDGERLTESGLAVGTLEYMSPEQGTADSIDQRSDIYSMGCVFYEMLSGAPPFTGPSAQAIIARHARDPMPSIRTVRPTVSRKLDAIVAKALAKVPADRFATARDFQQALSDPMLLEDIPVVPPKPRRWPIVAGVTVVALAAVVAVASRDRMGPALQPNRVVGFPFITPALVGSSKTAGEDVATLIGSAIDRRAALRWIDGWRALDAKERAADGGVSARSMRRIARAEGAAWYLTGRIVTRGDSVDVLVELVDAATDSVAVRPRASGLATDLWRVAIRSVNQVLPVLVPGTDGKDLEAAWGDRDPGAVASFLAGEAAFRRARPGEALEFFRAAVKSDSGFGLAAVRGAQAATADHRPGEARLFVQRALASPLPPQYVEFVKGYVAYLNGEADSAVAAFRRAIRIDSELTAAWAQLGETFVHLVPLDAAPDATPDESADAAFAEARKLDPTATHLLMHPIEIAWRRGDGAVAAPMVERFLAAHPDSTLAAEIRLVDACGRGGPKAVNWVKEVGNNAEAVLFSGHVLAGHGGQPACAAAAYGAVLDMDAAAAGQPNALAARQAALVGELATLVAMDRVDSARARVAAAVALGDGGASLFMFASSVLPAFADLANPVAERDSARFGADMAGCASNERCWILGVYYASLGRPLQAATVARVLAARVATDTTGEAALYAEAAQAHALLASGDSAGAREALRALVRRPFPPGSLLTWYPIGGFGAERLLLATLLLAHGDAAEARTVAASLDAATPAMFPLFLRPSLELRIRAAQALGDAQNVARLRTRLARLSQPRSTTTGKP